VLPVIPNPANEKKTLQLLVDYSSERTNNGQENYSGSFGRLHLVKNSTVSSQQVSFGQARPHRACSADGSFLLTLISFATKPYQWLALSGHP
jgi:hypothetical protein